MTKKKETGKKKARTETKREPPPKRTGKSNLTLKNALDPEKDFETPTRKEPETPAQEGSLLAEQPPQPTVVGQRIRMHYLKPVFSKTAKGERLLAMHMTFPLTEEHTEDSLLPKGIREAWDVISKHGRKKLDLMGIPGQRAEFYMAPDIDDVKLTLPAAKVINVSLAVVQKKGEGESQKVIRLSFRLQVPVSHEVAKFAELNFGSEFWVVLTETQEVLFDEDEEE